MFQQICLNHNYFFWYISRCWCLYATKDESVSFCSNQTYVNLLVCFNHGIYHSVYVSTIAITIGISYIKLFTCFKHGYIIWFMFQPCVYQLVYHISSCVRVSNMDVSIGLCFNQIIQLIVPPSIRLEFDDNEMPKSYGDLTNLGLISVSPYILCWFMAWLHFNMLLCRWKVILHVLRTVLV